MSASPASEGFVILLMAGGKSKRLGRDKRLADRQGESLVIWSQREVLPLGFPVALMCDPAQAALPLLEGVTPSARSY